MKQVSLRLPALAMIVGGIVTILTMLEEIRAFNEGLANASDNEFFRNLYLMVSPVVFLFYGAMIAGGIVLLLGLTQLKRPSFFLSFFAVLLSCMMLNWTGFLFGFIGGVVAMGMALRRMTQTKEAEETSK